MEEEEMTMMKKATVVNIFKVLLIGALVAISTGALFEVDKYEYVDNINSKEYKLHKSKYKPIIDERNGTLNLLLNDLESGNINSMDYVIATKRIYTSSKIKLDEYARVKNELQQSYKFRGWNGYYYFRLAINPYLMSFVMGLLLLYIIFSPITEKWKKIVFSLFAGVFIFTSTYFILQALYSQQVFRGDFPESWYSNLMQFVPVLVALALPILFYHYQTIEIKLRNYVKSIFTYIYDTTDDIKSEKQKEHQLKRGELISKGLEIDG